jgi:hypothetical protein
MRRTTGRVMIYIYIDIHMATTKSAEWLGGRGIGETGGIL